jgi:FkbM family methyltransferase
LRKIDVVTWLERHGGQQIFRGMGRRGISAGASLRAAVESQGWLNVTVHVDGTTITGGFGDRHYLSRLKQRSMEPQTLKLWRSYLNQGMSVVDVGAYLGTYGLFAARMVGSAGRVWAVEPNPVSRCFLERNIRTNALSNVTVVPHAVSDHRETSYLNVARGDRSQASLQNLGVGEASVRVDIAPLDELIPKDAGVSLAKVDVEGAESAALGGMTHMLKNIEVLFVESCSGYLHEARSSPEELRTILGDHGFHVGVIREEAADVVPWRPDLVRYGCRNLLATR